MSKIVFGDKIGSTIDKYAAVLTLFILGIFLHFNSTFIISQVWTSLAKTLCFFFSSFILMKLGVELKAQGIVGIPEIALGSIQLYIIASYFPTDGLWSILCLASVGVFLFNLIAGLFALIGSLSQNSATESLLSKTESIITIITALLGAVFAGLQL